MFTIIFSFSEMTTMMRTRSRKKFNYSNISTANMREAQQKSEKQKAGRKQVCDGMCQRNEAIGATNRNASPSVFVKESRRKIIYMGLYKRILGVSWSEHALMEML